MTTTLPGIGKKASSGQGKSAHAPVEVVVVGTSAGGLRALEKILGALPPTFGVPIAVVQHRSRESELMASVMRSLVEIPIVEAEDKLSVRAPGVYLAPPDYHLLLEPGGCLALSIDDPVGYSRPSIDVLFESAADAFGPAVLGVLLTGANQDGARGLARIRAAGGVAIVQDPRTAESPEMPTAAIATGAVDRIVPLGEIADEIVRRTTLS